MSRSAVARTYAETLLDLASADGDPEGYGSLLHEIALLAREEEGFRHFLVTPRIPVEEKREALREVLGPGAPERFLRFLFVILEKRRQRAIPDIADAYDALLDERAGRVHAAVSVPFEPEEELRDEIAEALERMLGRTVVLHVRRDPDLIGGARIRVGDRVMDGSLRRRLEDLRAELAATPAWAASGDGADGGGPAAAGATEQGETA